MTLISAPHELATEGWVNPVTPTLGTVGSGPVDGLGRVVLWGRRAFTRGRALPAGGVLVQIDVEVTGHVPHELPAAARVSVDVRDRGERPAVVTARVELAEKARGDAETVFAAVTFVLLWPSGGARG